MGGSGRRLLRPCRANDQTGFYGAAEPGGGTRLAGELRPIDLIIQDELHLISGPLGTIAGLYETAFDLLASRLINGERRGPKIVASTATVRRAETQIRNLFGRERTAIFPPPGVDRDQLLLRRSRQGNPIPALCRRGFARARAEARLPPRFADLAGRGGRALVAAAGTIPPIPI